MKILGYYVTKSGTLTFYSVGGKPLQGDANYYLSKPLESLDPQLLETPLSKVMLKSSRGYYARRNQLTKYLLAQFRKAGIVTLRDLYAFYMNLPLARSQSMRTKLNAHPFAMCSSGITYMLSVLEALTESCPNILSVNYVPTVYFPVNIHRLALPPKFPMEVFNGKGPSPELVARIQKAAEVELGKLIAPMIIAEAEALEQDKITKAQERLEKLRAVK